MAVLDSPRSAAFLEDRGIEIAATDPGIAPSNREILELAKALDDHFAWEPFEEDTADVSPFAEAALDRLRCVGSAELDRAIASLSAFPAAAQRAMQLLLTDE